VDEYEKVFQLFNKKDDDKEERMGFVKLENKKKKDLFKKLRNKKKETLKISLNNLNFTLLLV